MKKVDPLEECFHKWGIKEWGGNLEVLGRDSQDQSIQVFRHKRLRQSGLMSHLERRHESPTILETIFVWLGL